MKLNRKLVLPISVLAICFVVGGPLQFVGAFSLTQTNYVALTLIALFLLTRMAVPSLYRSEVALLALGLYIVSGIVLNGSDITGILVYLYYLACPLLATRFVRLATESGTVLDERIIFRLLTAFLALQLIVTIIQNLLAVPLTTVSAVEVIPVDVVSGTFYMKSDGSLSAFCVLAATVAVWSSQSIGRRTAIVTLSFLVVMLANAKAFQQLFPLLVFWAVICQVGLKGRHASVGLLLGSLLGIIFVLAAASTIAEQWAVLSEYLYDVYDFRYGDNKAQRLAPLGEILNTPFSLFGKGALTYYNPISKQWLYNSGFSLVYNFYIDYGAVGLSLVLTYFFLLTLEFGGLSVRSLSLYSVFIIFCMFSPAITDIAFIIAYSTACYLVAHRSRTPAKSYQNMQDVHSRRFHATSAAFSKTGTIHSKEVS